MSMLIIKFGGTSLGNVDAIERAFEIVRERLTRRPVVVVSALSGVTDQLLSLAERKSIARRVLEVRHSDLAEELGITPSIFDGLFEELASLLKGIEAVGELSAKALDQVAAYGERLSATLFAAYLSRRGIAAKRIDADSLGLITDSNFGGARPLPGIDGEIRRRLVAERDVPVVTGYVGRDSEGNVTTLGRHGSDYTASILGRAVRASEIQIWTDVDGVMSADPRIVASPKPLERIAFLEACALARSGARVLHPSSLQPAIEGRIPVRVLNSKRPSAPGTLILEDFCADDRILAIVHRRDLTLHHAESPTAHSHDDQLLPLLEVCRRHKLVVEHMATSATAVTILTSEGEGESCAAEMATIAEVSVRTSVGRLSVISRKGGLTQELIAESILRLDRAGIPIHWVSASGEGRHLSLIIPNESVDFAVRELHTMLIESSP